MIKSSADPRNSVDLGSNLITHEIRTNPLRKNLLAHKKPGPDML